MTDVIRPWPYASRPYVQFEFKVDRLVIWITFPYSMDTDLVPAANLFTVKVDGVDKGVAGVNWVDPYTLSFQVLNIPAHPTRVLSYFNGPSKDLRIRWDKQWEPWGKILCSDVPLDWEHILTVDVDNTRVTINGQFLLSSLTLTAGLLQTPFVTGVNVLFLDCSAGDLSIRSFANGINGQVLYLARLCATPNDVTLRHFGAPPGQNIFLHAGADETLRGEYGGWVLVCNGTNWYDVSHAKHV